MQRKFRLTCVTLLVGFLTMAQHPDIVEYKDISVNGIDVRSTETQLIEAFGPPISITSPNYECGGLSEAWNDIDVTLYRWEGIEFHMVDGIVEVGTIDFTKANPKIKTKQLTFDKSTTLDELQKAFPNSFQIWKERNRKYGSKILSVWPSEFSDSEFHIIIEKGNIVTFTLYHPC